MSEASVASQVASTARANIANHVREARESVKPEHAGRADQTASAQFDSTGQILSSSKSEGKHTGSGSIVNLLA